MLPVEQDNKDEDWFDEIDASILQFKQKIHGWIRDVEKERDATMEAKSERSSVSGSESSKRSSRYLSASSSGSRSSKSDKALKEKLRMAELLTKVQFLEERQTAEFKAQKLKVEEQYAKSRARVKVSEDLEGDNVNLAISHNAKIDIACNPVNNRNIESGMIPTRKDIMPKKFEAHQNVEAHQAPAMFFYDIKIGDECSNIKAMLPSREPTDMLCKFLKVQSAPDVDMECFDGNVLEYHYFMALFREVVESKIEDPRGRLTRLIKYTVGDARDLIKHCIQLPSNEGFTQAKYLLEKMYGNPHRMLASYRKEVKDWPQIKFGDSRGFRKFHSFLLKCRSVAANQRWNTLNSPDILYMMASKLHGGLTERWKREVSKIRRHHRREPDLEDFIMYIEEETMLMMSDPLFS